MYLHEDATEQQSADGGLDIQGITPEAVVFIDLDSIAFADVGW